LFLINRVLSRKFFGFHRLTAEELNDPAVEIVDLNGYNVCLTSLDLAYPEIHPERMIRSDRAITPINLPFGASAKDVRRIFGKPILQIDNSKSIPGHMVMVYKRHIWAYRSCCQIHFLNQRLYMVIDEIKKPFRPGLFIAGTILHEMGYEQIVDHEQTYDPTYITDDQNNLMMIEEEILVRVRVQEAPGIQPA